MGTYLLMSIARLRIKIGLHLIGTVFSSYNGLVQSGRLELISLFYKYLLTFSVLFFSVWLKKPHTYIPRYVFFFFDAFNHIGNKIKKVD